MATEIISTDLTATYLLDRNDDLFLTQSGSVIVDGADAIHTRSDTDTRVDLYLLGTVKATGPTVGWLGPSAVYLGAVSVNGVYGASHNSVTVGTSGRLEAWQGCGIASVGSAATITNHGTIDAALGIVVRRGDNRVENTGTITATSIGIRVEGSDDVPKGDFSLIHNSGTIQTTGQPLAAISTGVGIWIAESWVRFTNDGVIDAGQALLSLGRHAEVINSGSIATDVELYFGEDHASLINSGTITCSGKLLRFQLQAQRLM